MLSRILLLGIFLSAVLGMTSDNTPPNEAGFVDAVFDSETIEDLLNRKNCDGVRFYNSLSEGKVFVMAVGISEGADIQSSFFTRKPYAVSKGIEEDRITIEKVDEEQARAMCEELDQSRFTQYSTHFSRKEIETLLNQPDCNAIQVKPGRSSDNLSMMVSSVNFNEGRISNLGEGEGFEMLAIDPCPPVCGNSGNYLYQRL
jgi:hypothetical protein